MSLAATTGEILGLARSRDPGDRERLLTAIVDLCDASPDPVRAPPVQSLLATVFLGLVVEAERDIRKRLAERLSGADWAPSALINVLALDDIEIARPIIAQSPILQDHDLMRLLVEATIEHQIEVARRPKLGPPVVAAILQQAEPAVLTALAGNPATHLAPHEMAELVRASRRIAALRSPLVRRPELTDDLARELYVWVGQALRQSLTTRFRLDPIELDKALAESVREAHGGIQLAALSAVAVSRDDEREEMERKLIAKLDAAGQLRPGYLLRTLREGRLSLFVAALAALGRFEISEVRTAINADKPDLLGLACAAVGIDRGAFPTLLSLVRELNGGLPGGGAEGARRAAGAFGPFTPEVAAAAFRQAAKSV